LPGKEIGYSGNKYNDQSNNYVDMIFSYRHHLSKELSGNSLQ